MVILAQTEQMLAEKEELKTKVETSNSAMEQMKTTLEAAQKIAELEYEGRQQVEASIKDLQEQLAARNLELSASYQQNEATKGQVSELKRELKDLREAIPTIEAYVVENLCAQEGPFVKISDLYVADFYKAKELALDQPDNIMGIEVPSELEMTPELEAKVAKKRPDAFAIL